MKITADTNIQDALKMGKEVREVFKKYNLDCAGCRGASQDTIARAVINNGLDPDAFLAELNSAIE